MHNSIIGNNIFAKYLEPEEQVYYIAHNHPIILVRDIIFFILVGLLLPYGLWFSNPDLLALSSLICGLSIIRFSYQYSLYFYDCWIITNKGIIDIEWISFFNRKIIRVEFEHFEGISTSVRGFLNTIFRKGDVTLIRIIEDDHQISIKDAYRPVRIESEVLHAKDRYHKISQGTKGEHHDKVVELLSDMLHDHAKRKGIKL